MSLGTRKPADYQGSKAFEHKGRPHSKGSLLQKTVGKMWAMPTVNKAVIRFLLLLQIFTSALVLSL